jgi:hypothetical protein
MFSHRAFTLNAVKLLFFGTVVNIELCSYEHGGKLFAALFKFFLLSGLRISLTNFPLRITTNAVLVCRASSFNVAFSISKIA